MLRRYALASLEHCVVVNTARCLAGVSECRRFFGTPSLFSGDAITRTDGASWRPFQKPPEYTVPVKVTRRGVSLAVPNKLSDIVKLPLFRRESPEECRRLWMSQFVKHATVVVDTTSKEEFERLEKCATKCPHFVVPVGVGPATAVGSEAAPGAHQGYMILVVQFQRDGRLGLLTPVEAFQKDRAAAVPVAIVQFFPELSEEKGLVFTRVDGIGVPFVDVIQQQGSHLSGAKQRVAFVWEYLRAFYGDSNLFSAWVQCFNERPREFDFDKFMQNSRPLRQQLLHLAQV